MTGAWDVVIVGGAVMGSSIAYHAMRELGPATRCLVVEADPSYRTAATALSAGSIRQQFSASVNVQISLYGIAFLREIGERLGVVGERPSVGLHEGGYLFLATPAGLDILSANQANAARLGADIVLLQPDELAMRFPWLNTSGLAAASFGASGEGWFDGYGLMQAFRAKALELGASFVEGRVDRLELSGGRVAGLALESGEIIPCGTAVLAAGSDVPRLLGGTGLSLPVRSRKRMIFTFTCRERLGDFPLLIDPTGVYVRPEGEGFLCGTSPPPEADPDSTDFEIDWSLFDDTIWPVLAARVPAFETIRPGRAWAGHYDLNLFDQNAFVGAVPEFGNLFVATGFSGHGLQQSPAVGRGIAELIAHGRYRSLDLGDLGCGRLLAGEPLVERNVV